MRRTLASFDDLTVLEMYILNAVGLTSEQKLLWDNGKNESY